MLLIAIFSLASLLILNTVRQSLDILHFNSQTTFAPLIKEIMYVIGIGD